MLKKLLKHKSIRVLVRLIKSIIKNDFYGMAAEMGFMLVVGIFPFMLFLTALFGWLGKHSFMNPLILFLQQVMPDDVISLIETVLNEVWFFSKGGLVATFGFCVTVMLSTNALAIVLKGLNRAYKVEETRSFIYTRLLALIMVFVNALVLFLSINLIVFGKVIIKFLIAYLGVTVHLGNLMLALRWPIAFVALIHFFGDKVKAFSPASFLNPSNSRGLKFGLYKLSQIPRYSIVFRLRNQLPITEVGSSLLYLAISVKLM